MAVAKKNTAKKAVSKKYAINSNISPELGEPFDSMEEVLEHLDHYWCWDEGEVVFVYELTPVNKFRTGKKYEEVK